MERKKFFSPFWNFFLHSFFLFMKRKRHAEEKKSFFIFWNWIENTIFSKNMNSILKQKSILKDFCFKKKLWISVQSEFKNRRILVLHFSTFWGQRLKKNFLCKALFYFFFSAENPLFWLYIFVRQDKVPRSSGPHFFLLPLHYVDAEQKIQAKMKWMRICKKKVRDELFFIWT